MANRKSCRSRLGTALADAEVAGSSLEPPFDCTLADSVHLWQTAELVGCRRKGSVRLVRSWSRTSTSGRDIEEQEKVSKKVVQDFELEGGLDCFHMKSSQDCQQSIARSEIRDSQHPEKLPCEVIARRQSYQSYLD